MMRYLCIQMSGFFLGGGAPGACRTSDTIREPEVFSVKFILFTLPFHIFVICSGLGNSIQVRHYVLI